MSEELLDLETLDLTPTERKSIFRWQPFGERLQMCLGTLEVGDMEPLVPDHISIDILGGRWFSNEPIPSFDTYYDAGLSDDEYAEIG